MNKLSRYLRRPRYWIGFLLFFALLCAAFFGYDLYAVYRGVTGSQRSVAEGGLKAHAFTGGDFLLYGLERHSDTAMFTTSANPMMELTDEVGDAVASIDIRARFVGDQPSITIYYTVGPNEGFSPAHSVMAYGAGDGHYVAAFPQTTLYRIRLDPVYAESVQFQFEGLSLNAPVTATGAYYFNAARLFSPYNRIALCFAVALVCTLILFAVKRSMKVGRTNIPRV